jgi:hypothetical protein
MPAKETQCQETLLTVGKTIIFIGESDTLENSGGVDEIQPMILQVQPALRF